MARHYKVLKRLPGSFQLRFEDAQRDLNSALLPVLREFYPEVRHALLRIAFAAVAGCLPSCNAGCQAVGLSMSACWAAAKSRPLACCGAQHGGPPPPSHTPGAACLPAEGGGDP